jgi:hypothetical protein
MILGVAQMVLFPRTTICLMVHEIYDPYLEAQTVFLKLAFYKKSRPLGIFFLLSESSVFLLQRPICHIIHTIIKESDSKED